jgi:hypothetical protein
MCGLEWSKVNGVKLSMPGNMSKTGDAREIPLLPVAQAWLGGNIVIIAV